MKTLSIIAGVILSLNLLACAPPETSSDQDKIAKNVDATEFNSLFTKKGGQMVDVRTPEELQGGFIPGAVNMDFYADNFDAQVEKLDPEKPVFVYCAAGGRSGQAMKKLHAKGFKEVYNLNGGFPTWESAGYDVQH